MPNGEGISNPRYKQADNWRALLLGMLIASIHKNVGDSMVVEIDAKEGWLIMQTIDGNFKVELTVSF